MAYRIPTVDDKDGAALRAHRDSLSSRLEAGYERIEMGLAAGKDVTEWEDFCLALLREYERVCQALVDEMQGEVNA